MRLHQALTLTGLGALVLLLAAGPAGAQHEKAAAVEREDYMPEPLPPGFQVTINEVEGPVFADANGKTLYTWPLHGLRNGDVGDRKNVASNCTAEVTKVNDGLMSPYPEGYTLPDLATRPACVQLWPPVVAADDAKPVVKWTIIKRTDGAKQWAYNGLPVYTSNMDKESGDVLGGSKRGTRGGDNPGIRVPIAPHSNVPPAFDVAEVSTGRMLVNYAGFSVYSWDGDKSGKSNCFGDCLKKWNPALAAEASQAQGEWTIIQRSPGVRQWAFRGRPLYTYAPDTRTRSLVGSDEAGWHNVYTQHSPERPKEFTEQDSHLGLVLADAKGKTIYLYACGDDALDQQACDNPGSPQEYRIAVCGGGDAARCLKTFPPVPAAKDAKAPSRTWTAIDIDPLTGLYAQPGAPGSMHVWAYRGRPVYTFAGDHEPGDTEGDAWGEFYGFRNGYKAFWLRDDFFANAG